MAITGISQTEGDGKAIIHRCLYTRHGTWKEGQVVEFAVGYPRDPETKWILFPRDTQERKTMFFPEEVASHPAKMNFHLQQAIIEYVAKPGDTILDPFGGTGTLMIAALQGVRVILIEIEEGYHQLEQQAKESLNLQVPGAGDLVFLLHGDNRLLLPIPCNHIITSPPYASALHQRTIRKGAEDDEFVKMDKMINQYSKHPRNIGALNNFLYNMEMEKVYRLCNQSIMVGGTMTIVIKDRIEQGNRVYLTKWVDKVCKGLGLELLLWEKWKTPGIQFTAINKLHGLEVVEDESVMTYRRVK